jgi:hypothetical protein
MTLSMGDWPLHILASLRGPIGFCPEVMAVYRLHKDGVWTGAPEVSKLDAAVRMYHALGNLLPDSFRDQVARNLEKNHRLIAAELLRGETARQAKRSRRFRQRFLQPLAVLLLYFLSFGPVRLLTSQVGSPSMIEHVEAVVYYPWELAYVRTPLHKPLGLYMHLWCPRSFDQAGNPRSP